MIPITPETVKATYEYLLKFPPFLGWRMHPSSKMTFRVVDHVSEYAQFSPDKMEMRVSNVTVSKHQTLLKKVAHEMIHVHEHAIDKWSKKHDSAFFLRCRDQVCKRFDFDPADF